MNFDRIFEYRVILLNGFLITLRLSAIAIVSGTVLGLVMGVLRTSKNKFIALPVRIYVEIFRGTPLLIQLFMAFYGIPYLGRRLYLDMNISIDAATIAVFTLYGGAFVAEIIRGGIQSIPKGQTEAAHSIGLSQLQTIIWVILPQAFKVSLPPLIGFYLATIKDTSIASIIGYSELVKEAQSLANVISAPFEIYIVVALMYFIICYPLSFMVKRIEQRRAY
ncbi:MAG: amino acid ABC transporter permease [Treponema sp.]|jgi:polar amino acid transport system permease protein|nr:amino acid ABC transporter permease [Treponema sp.]